MAKLPHNGQGRVLRALQSGALSGLRDIQKYVVRLYAEENQMQMFEETKLSEEQVKALRAFHLVLERVGKLLGRIHRMQDKSPRALEEALKAERTILDSRIHETILGLQRVQYLLEQMDVEERAREAEGRQSAD